MDEASFFIWMPVWKREPKRVLVTERLVIETNGSPDLEQIVITSMETAYLLAMMAYHYGESLAQCVKLRDRANPFGM